MPTADQLEEARPLCLEPSCGRRLTYSIVHNAWLCDEGGHRALTGKDAAEIRDTLASAAAYRRAVAV